MKLVMLSVLLVAIAGIALWMAWGQPTLSSVASPATAPAASVLGVNEMMKNVDRHRGHVRLQGVVSAVAPQNQSLALIDTSEAKACGAAGGCAELTLPVRWTGAMPTVGQSILLSGSVEESNGKLLFAAQTLVVATTRPEEDR